MNITATELKNRLGQYLEACQREDVIIEKSGRQSGVVMSMDRYSELLEMEDRLWSLQAARAEQEGYASQQEVHDLLKGVK